MNPVISYYDKNAEEFCRATKDADMSFCRDKFLHLLEQRNYIKKSKRGTDGVSDFEYGFRK